MYFSKVPNLAFNELKLVKRVINKETLFDPATRKWEVVECEAVEIHLGKMDAIKLASYTSHSLPKCVALRINGELFAGGLQISEIINDGVVILTAKIEEQHFKKLQKLVR